MDSDITNSWEAKLNNPISKRRIVWDFAVFVLAGLFVRAVYVAWVVAKFGVDQYSDPLCMHKLAESIAAGNGFTIDDVRIFNQSMAYPLLVGATYKLFGSELMVALALNTALGAFSAGLVYLLGLRLFEDGLWKQQARRIAGIAAGVAVVYPDSLLYAGVTAGENLLVPSTLLFLLFVLGRWKSDWILASAVGVVAAVAANAKVLVVVVCLFVPFIWKARKQRFVVRTVVAALVGIVCILPWTVLNYRVSGGHIIPFAEVIGETFLDSNNPDARGVPTNKGFLPPQEESGKDPITVNRMRIRKAMGYIKADPAWFARLCVKKFLYTFSPVRDYMFQDRGQDRFFTSFLSRWLTTAFNAMILFGILAGLITARRDKWVLLTGVALYLSTLVIQIVFCAYPRYRFPFFFCMLPFCVIGWEWVWGKIRRKG